MGRKLLVRVLRLLLVLCFSSAVITPASAALASSVVTAVLFADTFSDGDMAGWTIFDAPGAISGPSIWSVVDAKGSRVLRQGSNIYTVNPPYEGTYVVTGEGSWTDYHLSVDFNTDDNDGVYFLFRYTDDQNHYRLMLDQERHYRRLEKKVGGSYSTLAEDTSNGYGAGWQNVHIAVAGSKITVWFNYTQIFEVNDTSLAGGKIGLGTWGSVNCYFDQVAVSTTGVNPYADAVPQANIKSTGNSYQDPIRALGRPRAAPGFRSDFLSLGGTGYWVVFDMGGGEEIVDSPGNDVRVYEVGNAAGGINEPHNVYAGASPDGPWLFLGQGSGTSELDLTGTGLETARYVRIEDLSTNTSSDSPGSDIDAVQALNVAGYQCIEPPAEIHRSISGQDVVLSWSPVAGAEGYNVYGSRTPGATGTSQVNDEPIADANYTHYYATNNRLYYEITSLGPDGCESRFSAQVPRNLYLPLVVRG